MVRYAVPLLSNKPASVYEYDLSQPTTAQGNSSRILSATKSPTYLFLVGAGYCLVNVPLTTDLDGISVHVQYNIYN